MKRFRPFFLITLFLTGNLLSQVALTGSYVPPKFPKGPKEFSTYAQRHIKYPQSAYNQRITGIVDVTMYINKEGKVKLAKTTGSNMDFNNETKRVLKLSPNWEPGLKNGNPIDTMVSLKVFYCFGKVDSTATENDICILIYQVPYSPESEEKFLIEEKQRHVKMTNAKKLNEEGSILLKEKHFEEALEKFNEAIRIAGNVNAFLFNRGLTYLNLKQDDKAREDFLEAYRQGDEDSGKIYNDLFK
jgi:tetratricopeptide (TPR) repeat protein